MSERPNLARPMPRVGQWWLVRGIAAGINPHEAVVTSDPCLMVRVTVPGLPGYWTRLENMVKPLGDPTRPNAR